MALGSSHPELILFEMLSARDEHLVLHTMELLKRLCTENRIRVDRKLIIFFARQIAFENSQFTSDAYLKIITEIVCLPVKVTKEEKTKFLSRSFLNEKDYGIRNLFAHLLEHLQVLPDRAVVHAFFGAKNGEMFFPYLSYT